MTDIYSPGQARILFRFWPDHAIDWFVIGGPANGNEAQTVREKYPAIKCIGFEPNPDMFEAQATLNFPGIVYPYALWSRDNEELILKVPLIAPGQPRSIASSLVRKFDGSFEEVKVKTRTIDSLSQEFGPFKNALLWLDIEEGELEALHGAVNLFREGQIIMTCLEVFDDRLPDVSKFMHENSMRQVDAYGRDGSHGVFWCNYIYVRADL